MTTGAPHRSPGLLRRVRVAALLGFLLAAGAPASAVQREAERIRTEVLSWLEKNEQAEHPPTLPKWGEGELPVLVELLGEEPDFDSPRAQLLAEVLASLRPSPPSWLARNVTSASPLALRIGTLRVFAAQGTARESVLCAELVPAVDAEAAGSDARRALAGILQRDERAPAELWAVYQGAAEPLRPYLVDAVGDVPRCTSLGDLEAWLESPHPPYVSLLGAIERVAGACEPPFSPELCAAVRAELEDELPEHCCAAARALGTLEDEPAIPRLIELLESEEFEVRNSSHDALRAISRCAFRGEPARWSSWYALESEWWEKRSEAVFADLQEAEEAAALAAINELAGRSLGRHKIAAELLPLLEDDRPQVRRMAVVALGQLRSSVAAPALERLLEEELEEPFQQAVQSALLATRESRRPGRGAESR